MIERIPVEATKALQERWNELTEEELDTAQRIVTTMRKGNVFEYTVVKYGFPPILSLQRGYAIDSEGTAEMLEYGAARFEGQVFRPNKDELPVLAAKLSDCIVFPTGHVATYEKDTLEMHQVSGFVDFDNPCVEVTGDVHGYSQIYKLDADPVLLG